MSEVRRRYRNFIMDSRRWDGFELRDGDIIITTPSKCGTTWMQMQCALLIFGDPHLPRPLTRLSPWLDVQTESVESVFAELAAQQHRRFIKTHTPLDGLPFDSRVTYISVGRDPRDVAISWDNHFQNMRLEHLITLRGDVAGFEDLAELMPNGLPDRPDDLVDRIWEWIEHEPDSNDDHQRASSAWCTISRRSGRGATSATCCCSTTPTCKRTSTLTCAASPSDSVSTCRKIVGPCSSTPRRSTRCATELTSSHHRSSSSSGTTRATSSTEGASGQWRDLFDDSDIARYDARVRQLASDDFLAWLHGGVRSTDPHV